MFLLDYLLELKWTLSILCLVGLTLLWTLKPKQEMLWLLVIAALAVCIQTRFGQLHNGRPIHPHDLFHYQIGSKYFSEFGYQGIYAATTQALLELQKENPAVDAPQSFRDLKNKMAQHIPNTDPSTLAAKSQFSPQRWEELKKDLSEWDKAFNPHWQSFVEDAGYNPSPLVSLWGKIGTQLIPTSAFSAFALTDLLALLGAWVLIWRTFGPRTALYSGAAALLFPSGMFSPFDWIGGSFLRFTWVLWLTLGFCCLYKKKYTWAGVALTLCAAERIFPGAWPACAFLLLAIQAIHQKKTEGSYAFLPLKQFSLGAGLTAAAVFLITHQTFHPDSWADFLLHVKSHGSGLYTNHFGWGRAISFHPHMQDVSFGKDTMEPFREWGERLLQRKTWTPYLLLQGLLLAGLALWGWRTACGKNKTPLPLATAWMGGGLIFLTSMPAQYYLAGLLPLFAITASRGEYPTKYFQRALLLTTAASVITQLPHLLNWSFFSVLITAASSGLIAKGLSTPKTPKTLGVGVGLCTGAFLLFAPLCLSDPKTPFPAVTVQPTPDTPSLYRTFLVPEGFEVTDKGWIIKPGKTLKIVLPPTGPTSLLQPPSDHASPHSLKIRTDRFFPGKLRLKTLEGNPLKTWDLASLGTLFDTLSAPIPTSQKELLLEWEGAPGTDIALFSMWITPPPL